MCCKCALKVGKKISACRFLLFATAFEVTSFCLHFFVLSQNVKKMTKVVFKPVLDLNQISACLSGSMGVTSQLFWQDYKTLHINLPFNAPACSAKPRIIDSGSLLDIFRRSFKWI